MVLSAGRRRLATLPGILMKGPVSCASVLKLLFEVLERDFSSVKCNMHLESFYLDFPLFQNYLAHNIIQEKP